MVKRFRLKPLYVEAIQFTGYNADECLNFCMQNDLSKSDVYNEYTITVDSLSEIIFIESLYDQMTCNKGDWIVKKSDNDFYVCKDSIFQSSFEELT